MGAESVTPHESSAQGGGTNAIRRQDASADAYVPQTEIVRGPWVTVSRLLYAGSSKARLTGTASA